MPLKIVKRDITKIKCDAIVNPTNPRFAADGGVDAAIHKAAGEALMKSCLSLGGCAVGEAKITPAFNLPQRFVIHTVGPLWQGGDRGERKLLESCYTECLKLAVENECESVAFPLISSGLNGYPKDRVLKDAAAVIADFLKEHELLVYLVIYDKSDYAVSPELCADISSFISAELERENICDASAPAEYERDGNSERRRRATVYAARHIMAEPALPSGEASLEDMLRSMDRGFAETLFGYIDKKGISDVEAYKRSNVDKKTFSKIKCNKSYRPGKITAVSFAVGLRLSLAETAHLLSTVGLCLSRSSVFDVIIEYFITTGNYESIFDVNEVLYQFDQPLLGV